MVSDVTCEMLAIEVRLRNFRLRQAVRRQTDLKLRGVITFKY